MADRLYGVIFKLLAAIDFSIGQGPRVAASCRGLAARLGVSATDRSCLKDRCEMQAAPASEYAASRAYQSGLRGWTAGRAFLRRTAGVTVASLRVFQC
jgi:hypothetical protein